MNLSTVDFPISITTGYQDPLEDFFVPLLKNCTNYDVAIGYFTSSWLRDAAEGIATFALQGGTSRWVISHKLSKEDADVILSPNFSSAEIEENLLGLIKNIEENPRQELCALISCGIIKFKISIPKSNGINMFHAKFGVAADTQGNKVAFSGSYNLTGAAKSNWEHINIFRTNQFHDKERVTELNDRFNRLWSDTDPLFMTIEPSHEFLERIKDAAGSKIDEFKALNKKTIVLRDYQKIAVQEWGKNMGRGIYAMATGSGKTITALTTIKTLLEKFKEKKMPLVIVIVLPLKHLLDQWFKESLDFGFQPIKCYESSDTWRKKFAERMGLLTSTGNGHFMPMVTNATFGSEHFQNEMRKIEIPMMFVADEAHNMGSAKAIKNLPENANFRLGLSATLERHNDSAGTNSLLDYFGGIVYEFTLEEAISNGFLTPYKYHPHLCLMTHDEYEEYLELTEEIKNEYKKGEQSETESKEYARLQGKRADLISGVESKLIILKDLLNTAVKSSSVSKSLIYCGSRKGEDDRRHIERTVKTIGDMGIKIRKFTARESMDERKTILDLFSKGELEVIAAIKCLDEGVDIPATRTAYILASTTNPREHVQRRGRVLRKSEGKEYAIIHDFLVAPPSDFSDEHSMLSKELTRAKEFSELAVNKEHVITVLQELADDNGVSNW